MKRQRGLSLSGLIFTSIIVVFLAITAFKIVPAYLEYQTIKRMFKSMAEDPQLRNASLAQLQSSWAARTAVDNVKSLPGENIEYTKDQNGLHVSAEYSVKVRIVGNINACIDFHPSSDQ